jgi:hypothetical protein
MLDTLRAASRFRISILLANPRGPVVGVGGQSLAARIIKSGRREKAAKTKLDGQPKFWM